MAKRKSTKPASSAGAEVPDHPEQFWAEFSLQERTEGLGIFLREHGDEKHQGRAETLFHFGDALRGNLVITGFTRDPAHANLGAELLLQCDCAAFEVRSRCKHTWAALLLADLEARAPRGKKPLHRSLMPGYVAQRYERLSQLRELSQRPAPAAQRSAQEWIAGWNRCASQSGLGASAIEVRYVLVRDRGSLSVFPLGLLEGSAIGWRALARIPGRTWSDLSTLDRRLLLLLVGAEAARTDGKLSDLDERLPLPVEVQDVVLRELARSGQALWLGVREPGARAAGEARTRETTSDLLTHADSILAHLDGAPRLHLDEGPPRRFRLEILATGDGRYRLRPQYEALAARPTGEVGSLVLEMPRISPDGAVQLCDVGRALPLALSLEGQEEVVVSAGDLEVLLEGIARLGMEERLDFAGIASSGACVPVLKVEVAAGKRTVHFALELAFDYGGEQEVKSRTTRGLLRTSQGWLRRDLAREREARAQLEQAGAAAVDGELRWSTEAFAQGVPKLLERGWRVLAQGKPLRAGQAQRWRLRSNQDWFELEGEVRFDDHVLPLPAVLANLKSGERFVALGDGTLGVLPERWLASWAEWLELGTREGERLRFARVQSWILDALLSQAPTAIELDAELALVRERIARFEGVAPLAPPKGFCGELRAYQREGLGWLAFLGEIGFGGCLADDMGLGKTVQVLAHLLARRKRAKKRPALIVVPRSLLFNWQREAARFAPALRVLDFAGPQRWKELGISEEASAKELAVALAPFDLVLTTYGTLRRDIAKLRELCFDVAVLDEAQAIKNAESQSAKAARLLVAEQRLALSGTPIENHLDELWSLFEFLNPGMLGRSARFETLLAGGRSAGGRASEGLRRALRPFLLRRTKAQVLTELPPKTEQVLEVELEGAQKVYYENLRQTVRASLLERLDAEGLGKSQIHVLQALLRLRQAACHAGLANPKLESAPSAKLEALLPRLLELRETGHKALVFSQFTSLLGLLKPLLEASGVSYEYLDGRTKKREEKVQRFQEDGACTAFLISLKAGGHGLNLTAADYVFLLDPWWNPAVEAQAIDRAHRMGQSSRVFAYRVIARGTIEEKVLALQDRKRELAASIFEDESASLRDLTREDLEQLLAP
ncbi:MAG: DEAD/DEAH box helicase [Planctomycetes bacterium]|nr:DEAD/DEAH box helicase [Planctomycetota bacterium]